MKKIITVLLVVLLTFMLAACNGQEDLDNDIEIQVDNEENDDHDDHEDDEPDEVDNDEDEVDDPEPDVDDYEEYHDDFVELPEYIYEIMFALEDEFEEAMLVLDEKHLALVDSLDDMEDIERYDEQLDNFLEKIFDKLDELYDQIYYYHMDIDDFVEEFQRIIELLRDFRFE